jgi:type II secretory pathway pseudopilin PulG
MRSSLTLAVGSRSVRRGAALPAALIVLVVLSLIGTGAFLVVSNHYRSAKMAASERVALGAAENGLEMARSAKSGGGWDSVAVGDSVIVPAMSTPGGGSATAVVVKRSTTQYTVTSTGTGPQGMQRRLMAPMRKIKFNLGMTSGVTLFGHLSMGGHSTISGVDVNPAGPVCPPTHDTLPGISTNAAGNVSSSGAATLIGKPPTQVDTSITPAKLSNFGGGSLDALAAMANIVLPGGSSASPGPVLAGTTCNTSVNSNWGDPTTPASPCYNYMPIIHVLGDLSLGGGSGQGILIVDGNLTAASNGVFYGPVIVRGTFRISGTPRFYGGVMALNGDINTYQDNVIGNELIQFSSCSIARATQGNVLLNRLRPLSRHGWADLGR